MGQKTDIATSHRIFKKKENRKNNFTTSSFIRIMEFRQGHIVESLQGYYKVEYGLIGYSSANETDLKILGSVHNIS